MSDTKKKPDHGKEMAQETADSDALFEVSKSAGKKSNDNETKIVTGSAATTNGNATANRPAEDQDALFEVDEVSKGNPCDDEPSDNAEKEKKESSMDKIKIEELTSQVAAANDKYLRLMAEFDNFKRRSAKEYERLTEAANERLIKDITEVRENFERAFKSNANGEKLLEGMKLIFSKLNSILQKHGLEVYAEAGQKFDPQEHDALMRAPHATIEEDHIVEVHERGYKLKGNIIKHAKVVVSSGKPEPKESDNETLIEIK
jgi:molecular chaperone GrpE